MAVASLDLTGRIVDANPALLAAAGYSLDELRGRSFAEFIERGVEGGASRFDALVSGAIDAYRVERRYRSRTGEVREVDLAVSLIRDDDGAPAGCLAILQDVTLHKAALRDARLAHRKAEETSRVRDEFLAVLSHELRTPLNAVLGWTRILRSRPTRDQLDHAISVIERNARAQARLIDDLLDLSRIITGKIRLHVEPVDVARIAAESIETVTPAADAKRIRLEVDVRTPLPPITADAARLQQVFWNLLSNAVKFTPPDGRVTLTLSATDDAVEGCVTDTGIGIPADLLPFVFDRFMQADSSTTRAHPGLGLGLAIVRHVVELHGGTVHAASPGPRLGATFRFTLPRPR